MAKRRPSGDGMVRKREDGRWEGRIVIGHKENSNSISRYIYADTQKELTTKLRQNIDIYQGVDLTEECKMTLSEWLDRWLNQMSSVLRPSTLDHYRGAPLLAPEDYAALTIDSWSARRMICVTSPDSPEETMMVSPSEMSSEAASTRMPSWTR